VKITADTNLLVRALVDDHPRQAEVARSQLGAAEMVALSSQAVCEFVWVLRRGYRRSAEEIGAAIRALMASGNVVADEPAIDAGLAILEAGGDFADGVIAFEGRWLGAEEFVSFDRKAVRLMQGQGGSARLLT
jgi:predicted nucleic-acid-binding protein